MKHKKIMLMNKTSNNPLFKIPKQTRKLKYKMFFGINEHNNYEIALSYNLYPDKELTKLN
jgi:hypothetical protein